MDSAAAVDVFRRILRDHQIALIDIESIGRVPSRVSEYFSTKTGIKPAFDVAAAAQAVADVLLQMHVPRQEVCEWLLTGCELTPEMQEDILGDVDTPERRQDLLETLAPDDRKKHGRDGFSKWGQDERERWNRVWRELPESMILDKISKLVRGTY